MNDSYFNVQGDVKYGKYGYLQSDEKADDETGGLCAGSDEGK